NERMRGRVSEGMAVRSIDGEKLGKVVACQPTGFMVEKGFLFPKDVLVPYERISGITNGEILLSLSRAELGEPGTVKTAATTGHTVAGTLAEEAKGAVQRAKEAIGVTGGEALRAEEEAGHAKKKGETLAGFGTAGEIRVPLVEEEIVTKKQVDKVG